jgi:hypothetical protein
MLQSVMCSAAPESASNSQRSTKKTVPASKPFSADFALIQLDLPPSPLPGASYPMAKALNPAPIAGSPHLKPKIPRRPQPRHPANHRPRRVLSTPSAQTTTPAPEQNQMACARFRSTPTDTTRPAKSMPISIRKHQNCWRQCERHPSRKGPQKTAFEQPDRQSNLAAGRPRKKLAKPHNVREGLLIEPFPPHHNSFRT